jgi:HEAT repeat protein
MSAGLLGMAKDREAVPLLISKLDDPKDLVRSAAVDALGLIGDSSAMEPIRKLANDPAAVVRERVINSLVRLNVATDADFQGALNDTDAHVRETASLIYQGRGTGVSFAKVSKDSSADVRAESAIQLGRTWGEGAEESLKKLLHDPDPGVQLFAAIALFSNGGKDGQELVRKTLASVSDSDEILEVASAFARLGDEKSLRALDRIYHSNWESRARANAAFIYSGIGEEKATPVLKRWVAAESDPEVKKTLSDILQGKIR